MPGNYILAFDQGTSSSRAILFDEHKKIVGVEQKEITQIYPKPGWVEQDAIEIYQIQIEVAKRVIEKNRINPKDIKAIGITNQRETIVVWDLKTGLPVYNAVVWQDKRTADFCKLLKAEGLTKYIQNTTGLVIDSYFSATKLHWILSNVQGLQQRADNGELLCGTIDTWLIWNLSGRKLHITDYSNASRTMIFDIAKLSWDKQLLDVFSIPVEILPQVRSSSEVYGNCDKSLFGVEIPIAGIAGDQQAALFGQTCFEPGMVKNTYGTGCFMLKNTGTKKIISKSGLLTTIAWGIDGQVEYALEGSVFIAGAAIKWLRDALRIIKHASETEEIANSLTDTDGVYVVPAFAGLGAPHWDMYARGAIFGVTQGVTDKHLVRATLESIAYQTKDVIEAMSLDSGIPIKQLNVDGGASVNNFLMQFQADILNIDVVRPKIVESTAVGAAALAGIAVGMWNKQELASQHEIEHVFKPCMTDEKRSTLYCGWQKAVKRAKGWEKE